MEQYDAIRLTDALPLMPRETAISYVIRLSAYYGCQNPEQFCKDMGIAISAVLAGAQEALSQLARATGASEEELVRWSPRGTGSSRKFINEQAMHRSKISRRSWKFCPHCAREDIAASPNLPPDVAFYGRAEWQCGLLDICAKHEIKLVHYRVRRRSLNTDLMDFLSNFASDLDEIAVEPCKPDLIDHYVLSRLIGTAHRPVCWLDELELCDAVSLARSLGAAMHDIRIPWPELTRESRALCSAAGLTAFANGPEGLLEAMRTIRMRVWSLNSPTGYFGPVARCLRQCPATAGSQAVGKALATAAFATFPFPVGETVFGVVYEKPILLRSRAARHGLGIPREVWKDLLADGPPWVVYSNGNTLRTLIDIEAAEAALRPHLPLVTFAALSKEYGLSNHELPRLLAMGVIKPNGIAGLGHRKTLVCGPDARNALDTYVAKKASGDHSTAIFGADNDNSLMSPISVRALSKRYAIEVETSLDLILRGKLVASKLPNKKNPYESVGVELVDALRAVYGIQNPMSCHDVRKLLQLHNYALDSLVDAGFLSASTRKFLNGRMCVFERTEVEDFHSTYITFAELVRLGVCRPGENITQKWRAEVVPAFRSRHCTIYFRSHFSLAA